MGNSVKAWRNKKGMTQELLAEKTGYTQAFISQIEHKEHLEFTIATKIAEAIGVTVKQISGEENCKLCDKETDSCFAINCNPVPVCDSCANAIVLQQVTFFVNGVE